MNEQSFTEQRDRTLEAIVMGRMQERIPGEDEEAKFLRIAAASTLLGRFPNGQAVEVVEPETTPLPPPAPMIEPAPKPPVKRAKPGAKPVEQAEKPAAAGSSGAIFEARAYVLDCAKKNLGVNIRIVMNLTGWDRPQATKFIHELQAEAARLKPKAERVTAGIDNLLAAVEALPEKPSLRPKLTEKKRDVPAWWKPEEAKYCPQCLMQIPPRFFPNTRGWESRDAYLARVTCGRSCPKKPTKQN